MEATTDLYVVCAHEQPLTSHVHLIQPSSNSVWSLGLRYISTIEELQLNLERLPALLQASFLLRNRQEATTQLSNLVKDLLNQEVSLPGDKLRQCEEDEFRGLPVTIVSLPDCGIHLNTCYGTSDQHQTPNFAAVFERCLGIASTSSTSPAGELHSLRRRIDAIRYNLKIGGGLLPDWQDSYTDPLLTCADNMLELCTAYRTVGMAIQLSYLLDPDIPLPHLELSEPIKRMVRRKQELRRLYFEEQGFTISPAASPAFLRNPPLPPPPPPSLSPPPTAPKEKRPRSDHD